MLKEMSQPHTWMSAADPPQGVTCVPGRSRDVTAARGRIKTAQQTTICMHAACDWQSSRRILATRHCTCDRQGEVLTLLHPSAQQLLQLRGLVNAIILRR